MGSLDDAIREHLELKRRLGASDDEIHEKEAEAFGKGNRPAPAEPEARRAGHRARSRSPTTASLPPSRLPTVSTATLTGSRSTFPPPSAPARPTRSSSRTRCPPTSPSPCVTSGGLHEDPVEDAHVEPHPEEDVLEETPEFLEETPEQDRLWFEQRPPKDFDFD